MKLSIELNTDDMTSRDAAILRAIADAVGPPAGLQIGTGDPPPITVWATDAKTGEAIGNVPLANLKSEVKVETIPTPPPAAKKEPKPEPKAETPPPAPEPEAPPAAPPADNAEAIKRLRQLVLDLPEMVAGATTDTAKKIISDATGVTNLASMKEQPLEVIQKGITAMEDHIKANRK